MSVTSHLNNLKKEIGKVIVGQEEVIDLIFISIIQKGHILFESVPGTGKTVLSKSISNVLGGGFSRIQFTPDVLPTDITGMNIYNPKTKEFELRHGPVRTNILLADEINRATPRTQSALLEVMEERQVTIDGVTHTLESPFIVLATQNPIESKQGTFDLPEAQMDRFFMKIDLGYPSFENERMMLDMHTDMELRESIDQVLSLDIVKEIQEEARGVHINRTVKDYILNLVHRTRAHEHIALGVSPRGAIALMQAAIGAALVGGRDYVTPDDVKYIAPYVMAHRIVLNIEGMTLTSEKEVIDRILTTTEVPVEYGVER
ncbi:AAA family ATPase [Lacicoccus alkaliphilus]|uniref:MoxR-like ATPase n=1 Tax=Lacicoccus alkaliphilus DSM 16010 TaxID=1123231 RepID=A0A1M7E959_9BACL|nr:MoxR family ATPase [Salinicoccus alkaliphilus]SHL88277.1 MoxR-like ATPase [Salinicoccus alkaliphilus DSM 16010]